MLYVRIEKKTFYFKAFEYVLSKYVRRECTLDLLKVPYTLKVSVEVRKRNFGLNNKQVV